MSSPAERLAQRLAQKRYRARHLARIRFRQKRWSSTAHGKKLSRARRRRWQLKNPEYAKRYRATAQYRKEQSLRARKSHLLKTYGITVEQYDALIIKHQNKCAVCFGLPTGRYKTLHIDHDHQTNKVRGLLCFNCNAAIGLLADDPKRVEQVLKYLTQKMDD